MIDLQKGDRSQKNLRISKEYQEWLENEAERRFGSSYKQGQIVETLINSYLSKNSTDQKIEEIHEAVVGDGDLSVDTSSTSSTSSSEEEEESELEEWSEKAQDQDELDLSDDQLREVKSTRKSIDKPPIYVAAYRARGHNTVSKDDFLDFLRSFANWSNNEYSVWNTVKSRMIEVPYPDYESIARRYNSDTSTVRDIVPHLPEAYAFNQSEADAIATRRVEAIRSPGGRMAARIARGYADQLEDAGFSTDSLSSEWDEKKVRSVLDDTFETVEDKAVDLILTAKSPQAVVEEVTGQYYGRDELSFDDVEEIIHDVEDDEQ